MMEANTEFSYDDHGTHFSSARGGPIFVSNHIGPIISAPDFKASLLQELRDLEAELVLADDFEEELTVDDLKVFTEEELVEKALKDEFEDDSGNDKSLQIGRNTDFSNDQVLDANKESICSRIPTNGTSNLESSTLVSDSLVLMRCTDVSEEKANLKRSKKRGRFFDRNTRAAELEDYNLLVGDSRVSKTPRQRLQLPGRLSRSPSLATPEGPQPLVGDSRGPVGPRRRLQRASIPSSASLEGPLLFFLELLFLHCFK